MPAPSDETKDVADQLPQHLPALRRYARALTGDVTAADDLVQDCVERALSRAHLWRRPGNLRAWLFTIMHNLNANNRRRAAARPRLAAAQPATKIPRVGYLFSFTPASGRHYWEACRRGLRELGYLEERTIRLEPRWANERHEALPALVADLLRAHVDVIVTAATPASQAVIAQPAITAASTPRLAATWPASRASSASNSMRAETNSTADSRQDEAIRASGSGASLMRSKGRGRAFHQARAAAEIHAGRFSGGRSGR